ncbi:unnamed protein product, partial [Ilex paraguariensis]
AKKIISQVPKGEAEKGGSEESEKVTNGGDEKCEGGAGGCEKIGKEEHRVATLRERSETRCLREKF